MDNYKYIQEVDLALRTIFPKIRFVNLSKYNKNLENVAFFLIKKRGENKKSLFYMAIDYFNCLLKFYKKKLNLKGFKISHIDTDLAKKLYISFLETQGSLYWGKNLIQENIKTTAGEIFNNKKGEKLILENLKEKIKTNERK